ncbi:MAG: DUF4351 domain-containing protein, partial [Magnetococcales bacterium]|nr:DUF4351 domain-containing protein [Magnetococcales bacterium]
PHSFPHSFPQPFFPAFSHPDFAERMYTCQHRAYDLHRRPVIGLAILADEEAGWRPSSYGYEMWGSSLHCRFNTVKLPEEADNRFWEILCQFEENQAMPYITSVERIGMRKGREEGLREGMREGRVEILLRQMQRRFGAVPDDIRQRVASAQPEELDAWIDSIFDADSLQAVFH